MGKRGVISSIGPRSTAFVAVLSLAAWGGLVMFHVDPGVRLSSSVESHRIETSARMLQPVINSPILSGGFGTGGPAAVMVLPPPTVYRVSVTADRPEVPPEALLNEGFQARVRFHVAVALKQGRAEAGSDAKRAAVRKEVMKRLQVRLHLAGAEFQPEGPVPLGPDLAANWSIIADQPRNLRGHIATTLKPAESRTNLVLKELPGAIPLAIDIKQPRFQFSGMAEAATLGLGVVASLISIIQFVWKWRERRASA